MKFHAVNDSPSMGLAIAMRTREKVISLIYQVFAIVIR